MKVEEHDFHENKKNNMENFKKDTQQEKMTINDDNSIKEALEINRSRANNKCPVPIRFITAEEISTYEEAFHEGNYAFSEGVPFNSCPLVDKELIKAWEEGWLYEEVYKEGEKDFHSGLELHECPYEDEQLIEAWQYGWMNENI